MVAPSMQAAVLMRYEGRAGIELRQLPVPIPQEGEVLVRMAAAPINPSDMLFLAGQYGSRPRLPVIAGFEGSGTVIEAGAGFVGRALVGRRVACTGPFDGDGTWAEYMRVPAAACLPLRAEVTLVEGACLLINPMTALALLDEADRGDHGAMVQTAAASQLGRMIAAQAAEAGVRVLNIVRRKQQAAQLREAGAEHVLATEDPGFEEFLSRAIYELGATMAVDAVGGALGTQLVKALPYGGQYILYGALAQPDDPLTVPPQALVFENKSVSGFWLKTWLEQRGLATTLRKVAGLQGKVKEGLRTRIAARYPLAQLAQALAAQESGQRSEGKILLVLDPEAVAAEDAAAGPAPAGHAPGTPAA